MLTMRTRYALKALTFLAEREGREPTLIGDLSARGGIPKKYLEAILRELKQHGILSAQRGRGGGYSLLKPPSQVTLADVIRALDGPIAPVPCLSRTAYRPCDECRNERVCGVRLVLRDVHEAMVDALERTTLEALLDRTREALDEAVAGARYTI
jgi:Rrf2 family protein